MKNRTHIHADFVPDTTNTLDRYGLFPPILDGATPTYEIDPDGRAINRTIHTPYLHRFEKIPLPFNDLSEAVQIIVDAGNTLFDHSQRLRLLEILWPILAAKSRQAYATQQRIESREYREHWDNNSSVRNTGE